MDSFQEWDSLLCRTSATTLKEQKLYSLDVLAESLEVQILTRDAKNTRT